MYSSGHLQVALSLANLATVLEALGDADAALALRARQRSILVATGAHATQVSNLDKHVARVKARHSA